MKQQFLDIRQSGSTGQESLREINKVSSMIVLAQTWRFPGKKTTSRVWWSHQVEQTKFIVQRGQCGQNLWRSGSSTDKVLENSRKDPLSLRLSTGLYTGNYPNLRKNHWKEKVQPFPEIIQGQEQFVFPMDRLEEPPNIQALSRVLRRIITSVMTPNQPQIKGWPHPT